MLVCSTGAVWGLVQGHFYKQAGGTRATSDYFHLNTATDSIARGS